MSTTKDAVRDLLNTEISKVLKHHDKLDGVLRADLVEAVLAAIQHSEQRETVPAGEISDKNIVGWVLRHSETGAFGSWLYPNEDHAMLHKQTNAQYSGPYAVYLAAPVAAPVPEAKAEQVTRPANTLLDSHINYTAAILHEAPACNPMGGEMRAYKKETSDHEPACNIRFPSTLNTPDDYCDCAAIRAFRAKRSD